MNLIDVFGVTDIGRCRKGNEDQFLVAELHKSLQVTQTSLTGGKTGRVSGLTQGRLLVVADGMGGAAAGDIASKMVVSTIIRYAIGTLDWFQSVQTFDEKTIADSLVASLRLCQRRLVRAAVKDPLVKGMGSTLTMAYITGNEVFLVHVGDTRCYRYNKEGLKLLTKDHTFAQRLLEARGPVCQTCCGMSFPPKMRSNLNRMCCASR
ncbi:MAG: PP2C family protein-serine/threonine phosphatase [Planctomycetota bacterium]|jgi:protein phosphatase